MAKDKTRLNFVSHPDPALLEEHLALKCRLWI